MVWAMAIGIDRAMLFTGDVATETSGVDT